MKIIYQKKNTLLVIIRHQALGVEHNEARVLMKVACY
jgi:hypothetical protein